MISEQPDPSLNNEAIPPQQPIAASPGPDLGQRRPRNAGSMWALALILFLLASFGFAALQSLH